MGRALLGQSALRVATRSQAAAWVLRARATRRVASRSSQPQGPMTRWPPALRGQAQTERDRRPKAGDRGRRKTDTGLVRLRGRAWRGTLRDQFDAGARASWVVGLWARGTRQAARGWWQVTHDK